MNVNNSWTMRTNGFPNGHSCSWKWFPWIGIPHKFPATTSVLKQVGTAARGGLRSHFVANRAWKSQVGLVKLLVFGFPGLKALTNILWPLAQVRSANVEANEPVANWWDEKIFHRWKPTTWRHQVEKFLFYMICKNSMGQVLRRHLWGWEGGKPIRLPHHRQWQRHHQPQHCPSGERTF